MGHICVRFGYSPACVSKLKCSTGIRDEGGRKPVPCVITAMSHSCASWRLGSPKTRFYVNHFALTSKTEIDKISHYCSFVVGIRGWPYPPPLTPTPHPRSPTQPPPGSSLSIMLHLWYFLTPGLSMMSRILNKYHGCLVELCMAGQIITMTS